MLIPTIFQQVPFCIPERGILHIGAHKCEEDELYKSIGVNEENILWIEGNPDLIQPDRKNMFQAIISNRDNEEVEFKITNNGESSSILNLKTHLQEHPHIHEVKRMTLKTITLNSFYQKYNIPFNRFDFINLDIQGAELLALQGATSILPFVKAIKNIIAASDSFGSLDSSRSFWKSGSPDPSSLMYLYSGPPRASFLIVFMVVHTLHLHKLNFVLLLYCLLFHNSPGGYSRLQESP